ncbi:hypothetical protein BPAE_0346g00010 [Botrytis paeoniae]|uniref:Uncharacterized protein n=1 Tax=Botrytis paeoniae TaxID=278948 RepID=A0A4Z1F6J6_9HELO|nr:hypothetical protein BPAE_0346g00010 [Botrytis paeoniae]
MISFAVLQSMGEYSSSPRYLVRTIFFYRVASEDALLRIEFQRAGEMGQILEMSSAANYAAEENVLKAGYHCHTGHFGNGRSRVPGVDEATRG